MPLKLKPHTTFLLASLLLWGVGTTHAQLRHELDLNELPASANVRHLTAFDGKVFFTADDGYHGQELWVHEPATDRTYLLLDARPGSTSSHPHSFLVLPDRLVFAASLNPNQSSGTFFVLRGGTTPERSPGVQIPDLNNLAYFKGKLYVASDYALTQRSLDDATGQRIHPNLTGSPKAYVRVIDQDADYLYFTSLDESDRSRQLFRFDGTDVEQLTAAGDYPEPFAVEQGVLVQNHLALQVEDNPHLVLVNLAAKQVRVDSTVEFQQWSSFAPLANTLLEHQGELYLQNARSRELPDIKRYSFAAGGLDPDFSVEPAANARWALAQANGKLYGWYRTGGIFDGGQNVYEIDPAGNHVLLEELSYLLESNETSRSSESALAMLDDQLYAYGGTTRQEFELLRYDLREQRVRKVADIHTGTQPGFSAVLRGFDESRLALMTSVVQPPQPNGYVTTRKTVQVYDPEARTMTPLQQLAPYRQLGSSYLFSLGDRLLLNRVEWAPDSTYWCVSLNTRTGEVEVIDSVGGGSWLYQGFGPFVEWQDKIYFPDSDDTGLGNQVQVYDPATGTTRAVVPVDSVQIPGAVLTNASMAALGDALYFSDAARTQGDFDFQLSRLDAQGVLSTVDLDSFAQLSNGRLAIYEDRLMGWVQRDNRRYSFSFKPSTGFQLLTYQGQPLGQIVLDPAGVETDSVIYFSEDTRIYALTKATDEVDLVVDLGQIDPAAQAAQVTLLGLVDDHLLFSGRYQAAGASEDAGLELYQYQLTDGVFSLAADVYPGVFNGRPRSAYTHQGRLYFTAETTYGGRELWSYRPDCFRLRLNTEPDSIHTAPNGKAVPVITNGTAPYTFRWSTGESKLSLSELASGFVRVRVTDANGCSGSASAWIETAVPEGVLGLTEAGGLSAKLFPNPTHDNVTVQLEAALADDATVCVYSAQGHLLSEQAGGGQEAVTVSLQGLLPGAYYVAIRNGERQGVYRVLKQ